MSVPIPSIHRALALWLVLVSALGSAPRAARARAWERAITSSSARWSPAVRSASDELIEIHNPTSASLPLDGLELVYASATRRDGQPACGMGPRRAGPPARGPRAGRQRGGHLRPNCRCDLRLGHGGDRGAAWRCASRGPRRAIDAVGWGTATSGWLEGVVAVAPATGASLERLPGGAQGSGQDTDDNAADFVVRSVPDPQNLASPVTAGARADPRHRPDARADAAGHARRARAEPDTLARATGAEATSVPIGTARGLPTGPRSRSRASP